MLTESKTSVKTYVTLTFDHELPTYDVESLKISASASSAVLLPQAVKATLDLAEEWAFTKSSRPEVGLLLAVLAAAVPPRARILEIGTGAGVGLTWIIYGLGQRTDVEVITVDIDQVRAERVRGFGWPAWVSVVTGDGAKLLEPASFDLIFPDSPDEKTFGIGPSLAALRPGGILLLDDMEDLKERGPERAARLAGVRRQLSEATDMICVDLPLPSGVILATKRRI